MMLQISRSLTLLSFDRSRKSKATEWANWCVGDWFWAERSSRQGILEKVLKRDEKLVEIRLVSTQIGSICENKLFYCFNDKFGFLWLKGKWKHFQGKSLNITQQIYDFEIVLLHKADKGSLF